ncbi:MAG: serine hydrolase [Leptolyngbyaceae cyanobacterium bins.349]|nr:serine hydrolase [Leptolyngbyaceae cyanobacterium bins.349]
MSESGGSSRRTQKGELGLLKRQHRARSRTTSQTDSRTATSPRGDLCQIEAVPPDSAKSRFRGWAWLFGQSKSASRRRSRRVSSTSMEANRFMERRPESGHQSDRVAPRSLSSAEAAPSTRDLYARPSVHQRETASQRARFSSSQSLSSQSGASLPTSNQLRASHSSNRQTPPRSISSARVSSASIVPLSRAESLTPRPQRGQRPRQHPTRLQSQQPTLIQASTSLQQHTVLQDQDTQLDVRRSLRSRKREAQPTRPRSRSLAIALYSARMLILSVGVGVLAGTILSAWGPATNPFLSNANPPIKQANSAGGKATQPAIAATQLSLAQELGSVKTGVQDIAKQYPGFTPGVFLIDLDTNNFMDWSGGAAFSAASTIKVPVLIAFFQDVDAGKIRLDEKLTMRKDLVATEAGDMQYLPVGAQFSALETATKMITISDNTATNMLIDRLGGIQAINQRFKSWGLSATQITSLLPDLKGTNTTSPKELASLMVRVSQGELVSLRSRDRLLDIMRRTVNNSQLPQGLGEGATIAHKTGDIGSVIGDVGLIDLPNGKRYATAVLIRRAVNDDRAYDLVQKISRVMYQHFVSAAPQRPSTPASPTPTTPFQPNLEPEETNTDAQHHQDAGPNTPEVSPIQAANP